jgi:large subunit ribosomal protein L21
MYAIFEDGSRQYRVEPGSIVTIDYRDVEPGTTLELGKVLLYQNGADTLIGRPLVEGARVIGEVKEHVSKKTMTQKFRRRKASKRLKGHTQPHLRVQIQHILRAGEAVPAAANPPATPALPPATE